MPEKKPTRAPTVKAAKVKSVGTANFEALLKRARPRKHYELLLYVTGNTPQSMRAIATVRSLCDEYLPKRHTLEVVDIYQQPARAAAEQIIAVPTLIKRFPLPPKRLIGDLSDRARVVVALNLAPTGSSPATPPNPQWVKL